MYPEKASELSTRVTVRVNTSLQLINMWKLIFQHIILAVTVHIDPVGVQNDPIGVQNDPVSVQTDPGWYACRTRCGW